MMPRPLEDEPIVPAPSGLGFRIRSRPRLRFLRSGGGAETLEVAVAPEPRSRPATAPLVEWTFTGPDREVRCTLYQMQRSFQLWATDMGAYHIDPLAGRIEMPESDDELIREQRMWGVPAALCCMHRGDLPLHAAAVEIGSRAVVLAAPRRHGKTTLALAFQRHGYRVLTEDLACCSLGAIPRLLPGPALLRVRPDVYHGRPPAGTHLVAARRNRVYLGVNDDRRGDSAPVPIAAVVFLRQSADGIALRPVPATAAIRDLWALSFRLPRADGRAQVFAQLTRLASACPIWNLYRPARLDSLDATVARLVEICLR
jgi:hypothetical protein